MITSKKKYKEYLRMDKEALGIMHRYPKIIGDEIWKFERKLRKLEYIKNCKNGILYKFIFVLYKISFKKESIKLGFSIPLNVFGPGLSIAHYGTIVVNGKTKVGKNCRIHEGVTIGTTNGQNEAPKIGDNVFIGTGAKIIGNIEIANDIAIGANSVVVKDFTESGITIAGVPAKKISSNNSKLNLLIFKEKRSSI